MTVGPDLRVDVVVDADHPRRAGEQLRVAGRPAGVRGARHRMAADEVGRAGRRSRTACSTAPFTLVTSVSGQSGAMSRMWLEHDRQRGHGHGEHDQRVGVGGPLQRLVEVLGGVEPVEAGGLHAVRPSGCSRRPRGRPAAAARITDPPIRPRPSTHTGGVRHRFKVGISLASPRRQAGRRLLVKAPGLGLP